MWNTGMGGLGGVGNINKSDVQYEMLTTNTTSNGSGGISK